MPSPLAPKGLPCLTTDTEWDESISTKMRRSSFSPRRQNLCCESGRVSEPLSHMPWHNTCASTASWAISRFTKVFHCCRPGPRGSSPPVLYRRESAISISRAGRNSRLSSRKNFMKGLRRQSREFSPLTWKALWESGFR